MLLVIAATLVPVIASAETMECEGLDNGTARTKLTSEYQVIGTLNGATLGLAKILNAYGFAVNREEVRSAFMTPTGHFVYVEAGAPEENGDKVISCKLVQ